MAEFSGVVLLRPRRPSWWRQRCEIELDLRSPADHPTLLKTVVEAAERLAADDCLSAVVDFQPALLCRILADRGFEHWVETLDGGGWRADFRRRRRAP